MNFKTEDYQVFQDFLEKACGIVLGNNKHYLVSSRLSKLMQSNNIHSLGELVNRLKNSASSALRSEVIEAMTTNETLWFRDGYPFEIYKDLVLSEFKNKPAKEVRVWSSACSSGQEPYSLSMATEEFVQANPGCGLRVSIVGTDISQAILNEAKKARYDALSVSRGLSEERKRRFFTVMDHRWHVNANIRSRVTFKEHNLMNSFSMLGRFDVIFCRNVLIYFSAESKTEIFRRMAEALNPGGYLFMGASESIVQYTKAFEMVRANAGVVYRLKSK